MIQSIKWVKFHIFTFFSSEKVPNGPYFLYVNIFRQLDPIRWKVIQCLPIEAENMGEGALRQVLTEDEWKHFLDMHSSINCLVQESNEKMRNSYLILDEYMRFLDNSYGRKDPSKSILDVGVKAALDNSGFDEEMFVKRGGKYKWSKADQLLDW